MTTPSAMGMPATLPQAQQALAKTLAASLLGIKLGAPSVPADATLRDSFDRFSTPLLRTPEQYRNNAVLAAQALVLLGSGVPENDVLNAVRALIPALEQQKIRNVCPNTTLVEAIRAIREDGSRAMKVSPIQEGRLENRVTTGVHLEGPIHRYTLQAYQGDSPLRMFLAPLDELGNGALLFVGADPLQGPVRLAFAHHAHGLIDGALTVTGTDQALLNLLKDNSLYTRKLELADRRLTFQNGQPPQSVQVELGDSNNILLPARLIDKTSRSSYKMGIHISPHHAKGEELWDDPKMKVHVRSLVATLGNALTTDDDEGLEGIIKRIISGYNSSLYKFDIKDYFSKTHVQLNEIQNTVFKALTLVDLTEGVTLVFVDQPRLAQAMSMGLETYESGLAGIRDMPTKKVVPEGLGKDVRRESLLNVFRKEDLSIFSSIISNPLDSFMKKHSKPGSDSDLNRKFSSNMGADTTGGDHAGDRPTQDTSLEDSTAEEAAILNTPFEKLTPEQVETLSKDNDLSKRYIERYFNNPSLRLNKF